MRFLFLLFVCLSVWADQITLKNGDRITGSIVKKDGGKLTVKSDILGEITMPWDQVESVKGDRSLYVTLPDGRQVQSTVEVNAPNAVVAGQTVPAAEISALRNDAEQRAYERMMEPSLLELWTVNGTLGFAGTQGNAETQTATATFAGARVTRADKASFSFNAIRASAFANGVSSSTAQAVRGGWAYARNVNPKIFVNTFNDYEFDRFQNLDLRFVLGGGLGYNVILRERMKFEVQAGGAYNREWFNQGLIRNSAEGYWGDGFSYKLNSITTINQTFRMFNNLSDLGAYRMNFDAGATTKLTKWLTWTLGVSDRFLSNPVQGRQRNDFLYTTGLGFTFAR